MSAKHVLTVFAAIGFIFFAVPLATYLLVFHGSVSTDAARWGAFGDYVGGLSTALLSFLSLLALLYTIHVQSIELRKATEAQMFAAELNRLTVLNQLQSYYLQRMHHQGELARTLKGMQGETMAQQRYGELEEKLREISQEIEAFHSKALAKGACCVEALNKS
ncbi:MAG: hypothetical protein AB7G75_06145 [Candidatus Binatia bacterium]